MQNMHIRKRNTLTSQNWLCEVVCVSSDDVPSFLYSFSVTLSSELVLVLALMVEDTVSSFTSCGEISTSAIPEARGAWPLCKDSSSRLKDLQFKKIIFFGGTRTLVTGFCNFSKAIIDCNFTISAPGKARSSVSGPILHV